ncbi:hypothetical protein MXD81_22510, partial [Microbacteriaceae bacterium K1510]|nr:hypothetical protein [Microbacteriaceae bacterium K1510]
PEEFGSIVLRANPDGSTVRLRDVARIELGEKSVKMTLPSGRGPTPIVRYRSHDIPYDQIKAVETRREIYGGSVAPVLLQGARLILK